MNYDDMPLHEPMHGKARHNRSPKEYRPTRCQFSRKIKFASKQQAQITIDRQVNVHHAAEALRVYKCLACNKYHLTSQIRRT